MLVMGCLAGFGWHCTLVVQGSREATMAVGTQFRLLGSMDDSIRAAELAQLRYRLSNSQPDLIASRNANLQVDALAASLDYSAVSEPATRRMLAAIMERVRSRQPVHDQLAAAGKALDVERQSDRNNTADGIRRLRWIMMLLATLGIVAVFSLAGLLRQAWRSLRRMETAQRILAQQLRGSLDSLSQGVAVFGTEGLLLNWNVCLRRMLDLPPGLLRRGMPYDVLEQHLGLEGAAFLEPLPAIHADLSRISEAATDEIHPLIYKRVVRRGADAQGMQIEVRRTLMRQGGFVLTLTDMTEQARAERMLYEAQKMQALGQLSGGIAHDFNNILTVILGSLDTGPDTGTKAGSQQQVAMLTTRMQRAARSAENGAALTRQLLAFARKQPRAPQNFDIILYELIPLLRHTIGDGIEVTCKVQPGLWPIVADAGQLESVVLNLALNARDAMPKGGRISIAAGNVSVDARVPLHADLSPGDHIRISVADTGSGMSPDVIAHAFEPFFTTKPEGSGTGLGLAMVSGFARQAGGAAVIQSEPALGTSPGTMITLYLPRASALPEPRKPAPALVPFIPARTGQLCILVVEDDALVREITVDILRGLGYRVSQAPDAETALQWMERPQGRVDLLLTDLLLPGALDGRELAAQVRQMSPGTRILIMSGSIGGMLQQDADPEDSANWIGKPFRLARLAAKVQALIGGSHGARDHEAA